MFCVPFLDSVLSCCGSGASSSAVICCASPLDREAALGRAVASLGCARATNMLVCRGFDFYPHQQQQGLNYLLGEKVASCTGRRAQSSCDCLTLRQLSSDVCAEESDLVHLDLVVGSV